MTQFSSRPPFNDDHRAWVDDQGQRHAWLAGIAEGMAYDPRPEFDRPQHNPTNPILTWARDEGIDAPLAEVTFSSGSYMVGGWIGDVQVTSSHVVHARRVLTRLANLTKEETA